MNDHPDITPESAEQQAGSHEPHPILTADDSSLSEGPEDPETPTAGPRRPKFRQRAAVGTAPITQTMPAASSLKSRQVRGLLAVIAVIILLLIALLQALRNSSNGPAAAPTIPPVPANSVPAGSLTAQTGTALAAVALVPAGGAGKLIDPHEATKGADGLIYVADPGAHAVVVYRSNGSYLRSVTKGSVTLKAPYGLTLGTAGQLYVLDSEVGQILEFATHGPTFIRTIGIPAMVGFGRGIARDKKGNLYVANPARNAIVVYNAAGALVRDKSTPLGAALGQFNQPSHVAVGSDGSIFVLDDVNQRLEKFDKAWNPVGQWPVPQSDTLHSARILARDPMHLIITDLGGSLLFYDLSTSPATITRHGLRGVVAPSVISVKPLDAGHVLVTDEHNRAVWSVALP